MLLPAVVSRTGGTRHYFDDTMVRYFTPDSPADLADAILQLARDPHARVRLAASASTFLRREGHAEMSRRYTTVLDELIATREKRSARPRRAPLRRHARRRMAPAPPSDQRETSVQRDHEHTEAQNAGTSSTLQL
jgi:hypothetical protein